MRKILAVLVLAFSTGSVYAQTHQHTQEPIIDGKLNPELIPDAVAYRLYFSIISPSPQDTPTEMNRRAAQIKMLNLNSSDEGIFVSTMAAFGTQYRSLVHDYNAAANAAWHNNPQNVDPTIKQQFLLSRDQLVQSTVSTLQANLSPSGWIQLSTFVKGEKINMKIQGGAQ